MRTMYIDDIKHYIYNPKMLGSADLYNCIIDGKSYVLKKFDFDTKHALKLECLSKIKSRHFILPKILVKDINEYYVGYLSETFCNSITFFDLSKYDTKRKLELLEKARRLILKMHSMGITHVDLHPGNILFCKNTVKICDLDDCVYSGFQSYSSNTYSQEYLKHNCMSPSIDIYNFNITTMSILYNIRWDQTISCDFTFVDKLNNDQKIIWEKVKRYETLSDKDFIIRHY